MLFLFPSDEYVMVGKLYEEIPMIPIADASPRNVMTKITSTV